MHRKLYYHKTDGGAEYLTDRWQRNPDGSKEGVVRGAKIIVRIDGDLSKDAEISIADALFVPKKPRSRPAPESGAETGAA